MCQLLGWGQKAQETGSTSVDARTMRKGQKSSCWNKVSSTSSQPPVLSWPTRHAPSSLQKCTSPLDLEDGDHTTDVISVSECISPCCLPTCFLPSVPSHIRVYLPPLDSGTPNTYCSKSLEFQAPLVFNEVFRIPVHSSMLTLKSLQLYVCSVNPQLQEELLVRVAARLLLAHIVLSFPSLLPFCFMTPSSFSLSPSSLHSWFLFYAYSFMFCIYIVWGEASRGEGAQATMHMWGSKGNLHSPSTVWVLAVKFDILRDCSYGIKSSRTGSHFCFSHPCRAFLR